MPAAICCENRQVWNGSLQKLHELLRMGDLAAFVGIVDDGGFAESARRRGVSASTLSRSVTRLEEQLKVTLLRRTTRSIEITPEGSAVLAEAREILDRSEALQEIAASGQAPAGPLRVNAPVPYVLHVLAPRLAEFRTRYPDIQLSIDMTDTLVDLIGSHAEVAIRLGQLPDSDMLHRPLGRTAWKLVAAPEYLDRKGWPKNTNRPRKAGASALRGTRSYQHIALRRSGRTSIGAARRDRGQWRGRAPVGNRRPGHRAFFRFHDR